MTSKTTYTAFCKEASGYGTTWIDTIKVDRKLTRGQVVEAARQACADAWGFDVERVHCIGIAEGDVTILHWED